MKAKVIMSCGLIIVTLASSSFALTQHDSASTATAQKPTTDLVIQSDNKIYDPNTLSLDSLQVYEKAFDFDWNSHATIAANKKKLNEAEAFLKKTHPDDYAKLNGSDQQALGKIAYKLGAYYIHVLHEFDSGIEKMNLATTLLQDKKDKAWAYNQLAYGYEQKYEIFDEEADKDKALSFSSRVITELYPNTKNKEVAFAYYVTGLVQNDAGIYDQAKASLQNAAKIYESIPDGKDNQYAITENMLANVLLNLDGHDQEALTILQKLQHYWEAKGNIDHNPYAAINFLSLGQVEMKMGKSKEARDAFKKGISILENLYGDDSVLLAQPYQMLSETYKKLGNKKLSSAYKHKANILNKA